MPPLDRLDDVLVVLNELVTGHLFLEFLRSDLEQLIEELLFMVKSGQWRDCTSSPANP